MNDEFLFLTFIPIVATAYIDIGLQAMWNTLYFNTGLTLYRRTYGPTIKSEFDLGNL